MVLGWEQGWNLLLGRIMKRPKPEQSLRFTAPRRCFQTLEGDSLQAEGQPKNGSSSEATVEVQVMEGSELEKGLKREGLG